MRGEGKRNGIPGQNRDQEHLAQQADESGLHRRAQRLPDDFGGRGPLFSQHGRGPGLCGEPKRDRGLYRRGGHRRGAGRFGGTGNIESYQYISKEDALKETKEEFGPDSALLDGLEEDNPLPASYRIKLQNLDYMYDTVSTFQNAPGVETVSYPQDVAETIVSLKNMVSIFGIAIIAVFVAVSLVIISNTIRLTVFARRREINIMKYVGATNGFIRLPFVVEGMFIGLLAAFIAYFAVWGGYQGIMNMIMGTTSQFLQSMADSLIPFGEIWYWVLAGFALTGMGTGALGSVLSIRKHLKV